jgi:hypothetical protein
MSVWMSLTFTLFIFVGSLGCKSELAMPTQDYLHQDRGEWNLYYSFPGPGYYSGVSQVPTSDQICQGSVIAGVLGAGPCSQNFGAYIYSMEPRTDTPLIDLKDQNALDGRQVQTIWDEANQSVGISLYYSLVPNPQYDTDGRYDVASLVPKRHYLETITGRPTVTCGTSGSVISRITDCANSNGNRAFYDGRKYGQSGEGDWKLVTLTANGYEVWRDERTQLLWSDSMTTYYNWCQAAGYSSASDTSSITGSDCSAGSSSKPGGLQPKNPISVCADATLLGKVNGVDYYTPIAEEDRKGALDVTQVHWRLPTIEDWKLADVNGLRKVLPNLDTPFWSATSSSNGINNVWTFNGPDGEITLSSDRYDNSNGIKTRCVGGVVGGQ